MRGGNRSRLNRGVIIYQGRDGRAETNQDILYCVVTRLEVPKAKSTAREKDDSGFIVIQRLADASGGMLKRRALHSEGISEAILRRES